MGSVSKLLGEMWNSLEEEKKQKYQKQAADLKEKHYKDHPEWKWSNKTGGKKTKNFGSGKLFPGKVEESRNGDISTDSSESSKSFESSNSKILVPIKSQLDSECDYYKEVVPVSNAPKLQIAKPATMQVQATTQANGQIANISGV